MKSKVILIDNQGNGFADAVNETKLAAERRGLSDTESIRLQMITEEMLSLIRSVTGEMTASFWLEDEGGPFLLHLTTETVLDKEMRYQLISSASSRKNEAANSFLGRIRDAFENAMAAEPSRESQELPDCVKADNFSWYADDPEWDRYEQSILRKLAGNIRVFIQGGLVHLTVTQKS